MRKVRKMIKAFDILEEQFVNVNETMVAGMADMADMNNTLVSQLVSASADIASNTADIASLVTDTATNNASIASNDVKLATLTGNVTSNTVDIASNTEGVASNSANIVSKKVLILKNKPLVCVLKSLFKVRICARMSACPHAHFSFFSTFFSIFIKLKKK